MNGTLEDYLKQVNRDALEMQEMLIKQYAKAEGATEALKASNQMEWVCRMENIRDRVNEVVLNDLIYQ